MRTHARLVLATMLTLAVTAGLAVVAALPATSATWAPRTTNSFDPATDLDEFESRILVRVNRVRARRDLPKVRVFQSCVDKYAERWARRLKRTKQMRHRDLDTVLDGCNLNWVGENLVSGTGLRPSVAVRAWMQSPPHRRVLLKRRANWAGIGVKVGGDGRTYAVLNFGDRT
jgi:uncharacterized protein YkwD